MPPCLLALWLAAQPDPGALDRGVQRAVDALALPRRPGFGQGVAVLVSGGASSPALGARVAGQLRSLGVAAPVLLEVEGRAPGGQVDLRSAARRARAGGAEWLLWLEASDAEEGGLVLQASLLELEPEGLWGAAPADPLSLGLAVVRVGEASAPPGPPPPAPPPVAQPGLRVVGRPAEALELPGRVLGLAACPGAPGAPEGLAVLTARRLQVFEATQGALRPVLELDLEPLPPAPHPTRDPVGQVICERRKVAFGHGGLARGYVVERAAPHAPWAEFEGLPEALSPDGRVSAGALVDGTNVLAAGPQGGLAYQRLAVPEAPPGWRQVAVSPQYRLQAEDAAAEVETGVGIAARWLPAGLVVLTTAAPGASRTAGADQVRLWAGPPLAPLSAATGVVGEVHASALARLYPGQLHAALAAWRPDVDRTTLLLWALEGAP
jgi:hypothetical protein